MLRLKILTFYDTNFTLRLKTILSLATSGVLIMMLSGEKLLKVEVLGIRQSESCFDWGRYVDGKHLGTSALERLWIWGLQWEAPPSVRWWSGSLRLGVLSWTFCRGDHVSRTWAGNSFGFRFGKAKTSAFYSNAKREARKRFVLFTSSRDRSEGFSCRCKLRRRSRKTRTTRRPVRGLDCSWSREVVRRSVL